MQKNWCRGMMVGAITHRGLVATELAPMDVGAITHRGLVDSDTLIRAVTRMKEWSSTLVDCGTLNTTDYSTQKEVALLRNPISLSVKNDLISNESEYSVMESYDYSTYKPKYYLDI
ncbi:hypothetical protein Tco_1153677 [Tanacetum coccineum]